MNISKALKDLRINAGYTQIDVVEMLEKQGYQVKQGTFSNWERGVREPNLEQFVALCDIYKATDIRYILTGVHTKKDSALLSGLNKHGREYARRYIDFMKSDAVFTEPEPVKIIRLYDMPASAGTGQYLDDSEYTEIEVPEDELPRGADYAIRISGDSMEPQIYDGNIVFVHETESLDSGKIGIFAYKGDSFCKKLVDGELHSLNEKYPPIPLVDDDGFRIFGEVIGVMG